MKTTDPHNRLGITYMVLGKPENAKGLGMNELSNQTKIPKPTLTNLLASPDAENLFEMELGKKKGQKMNIRLKSIIMEEKGHADAINVLFEDYLAIFAIHTKTFQAESVVHLLQMLSILQMTLYLSYLNSNTSFEVSQQIILQQLEKLKKTIQTAFAKQSEKTRQKHSKIIDLQTMITVIHSFEKASIAMETVKRRTKNRTVYDLLFDLDRTNKTHEGFIQTLLSEFQHKYNISKKQLKSIPLDTKPPESKSYKHYAEQKWKLAESEFEYYDVPFLHKALSKLSDKQLEERFSNDFIPAIAESLKSRPELRKLATSSNGKKEFLELLKSIKNANF